MLSFRNISAFFALCLAPAAILYAQSAPAPDAPAPQMPAGLTLPTAGAPTMVPPGPSDPPPRDKPKDPTFCGGPLEGVFTLENRDVPLALQGEIHEYMKNAFARIMTNLEARGFYAHMGAHIVHVRFAVYQDGSYTQPEVARASGDPYVDVRALLAVREVGSFPALPDSYHRPLLICLRLGSHMYPEDLFSIEDEPWLNKAVDSVKKPTAHAPIPKVQVEDPEGFPESTIGLDQAALEPSQAGMAESIEKKEGITCGGSQEGVYAVGAHYRLNNEDLPLLRRITSPIWTNLNYRESREVAGRLGADGYIRVRFAVRPDGSYFPPETTHSSGSAEDDELILSAIRRVDVFPHLPPDKTLPLVLCLSFYKNHKAQELQIGRSKKAAVKEPEE